MPLTFYPPIRTGHPGSLESRIDDLVVAAEDYKAVVLDNVGKPLTKEGAPLAPKDLKFAFNWEEVSTVLHEVRELPEATKDNKLTKAGHLNKLAEVYEVLRAARLSKLEAVRLALVTEAKQLSSGDTSQVA